MWWNGYWPGAWLFFGPMLMVLLILVCVGGMFVMMRRGHMRHFHAGFGPRQTESAGFCGIGLGRSLNAASERAMDSHSAFEEYRTETLRRLDQEQREFQEFIGQLRRARDKAEFDQFMAERAKRPSSEV